MSVEKIKSNEVPGKFSPKSARFRMALLLLLALYASATMRLDLSMAVVCMVKSSTTQISPTITPIEILSTDNSEVYTVETTTTATLNPQCQISSNSSSSSDKYEGYNGDIELTSKEISLLLSAAFYGGVITVLGASLITDRFSKKYTLLFAVSSAVISAFLFPTLIRFNFWAAFAARVFIGLGQGLAIPTIATIASQWFPSTEIASYAAMYTSGNQIAAVTSMPISSFLCGSEFGWPTIFYTFGSLGLCWALLWFLLASSTPDGNRFISEAEKDYLIQNIDMAKKSKKKSPPNVPYLKILTCLPFWACVIANISFNFSAVLMQAYLPTFLKQVLQVNLKSNGLMSMLPFAMQIISKNLAGNIGDALRKKGLLSSTTSVKLFQISGNLGPIFCFIILSRYIDCTNTVFGGFIIAIFGMFLSLGIPGYLTSCMLIAPRYTATLISMSLFLGSIANAVAPGLVGLINQNGTREEWNVIWSVAIGLHLLSAIFFFIFASGEIQPWAVAEGSKDTVEEPLKDDIEMNNAKNIDE